MAQKRLSMRKAKEILRLKYELGLSNRQIARSCSVSRRTVAEYIRRAEEFGITWPIPEGTDDPRLEEFLFGKKTPLSGAKRPLPDMDYIHRELRKKGVTLQLLWEEYRETYPEGYQLTQFCEYYSRWRKTLHPTMRLPHKAGEKSFCRLGRSDHPHCRPPDRGNQPGQPLYRRPGGEQLHVLQGIPRPEAPPLDRRPLRRLRVL